MSDRIRKYSLFIFFVMFGWIVYSPMTLNYLTNPDGIAIGLFSKPWSEGEDFGRIGIRCIDKLLGNIISPNMALIISLSILGVAMVLLIEILGINELKKMLIVGSIFLLSPNSSSLFTYYYCMIQYSLAFLLGILACWIIYKFQNRWNWMLGSVLIAFQLTLYQAYLSVTILTAIFIVIGDCIKGEKTKKIFERGIRLFLSGIVGIVGYLILLKGLSIQLTSSRGFDKMGKLDIANLPRLIINAYINFVEYFLSNHLLNNVWMFRRYINIVVILLTLILFIILLAKRIKNWVSYVIIALCVILCPIACEITTIIAPGVDTYGTTGILLVPAMSMVYMLPIWMMSELQKENVKDKNNYIFQNNYVSIILKYAYLFVIISLLWNSMIYTTVVENVMQLNYESTYILCQKISNSIDLKYGYNKNQKIMIVGDPELGNYSCTYEDLRNIVKGSLAEKGCIWKGERIATVCYQAFFKNYFGIKYQIPTEDEYNNVLKSGNIQNMDIFPSENSLAIIDDIVVIKLSELQK